MVAVAILTISVATYAVTINSVISGTIDFLDETNGPATVAVVDATYAAGETTSWHYHPGEAYVIVKTGSITEHEPCGGSRTFLPGQAFQEEPGHIHRVEPSATTATNFSFISVVPEGQPRTINVAAPICIGPPTTLSDCANDGWMQFTVPTQFKNQGECVRYLRTRPE
jgi:quercetin dioxygenase-like cupin family protein